MEPEIAIVAAKRSLDGLSVGDAFGECFFSIAANPLSLELHLSSRTLPNHRWRWTDDTAMACAILEVLERHGRIDQDDLANTFARRYAWDDRRGYGGTAHGILTAIGGGQHWTSVSAAVLYGMGSMGNGGAMRSGPLGAYFAFMGDARDVVYQATLSAEVTHAHVDGQAGAVAVALAAAFAARNATGPAEDFRQPFFEFVLRHTPDSQTGAGILQALELPATYSVDTAVAVLGNGSRLTAPDTVPFCIWCAARSIGDFANAMWTAVPAGGDTDTNCAIVGSIVAAGKSGVPPAEWIERREVLPAPIC